MVSKNNPELCRAVNNCRSCGFAPLVDILSLGDQYVSNFIESHDKLKDEKKYPLELVLCDVSVGGCGLLQLRHTVSPEKMYRTYWYFSGMNKTMTDELANIAQTAEKITNPKKGDIVVDIGCNDGTLLKSYQTPGLVRVGFEPAKNLVPLAKKIATKVFNEFFGSTPFTKAYGRKKAKVVTAIAMFYDLDDPNAFVSSVKKILDQKGIFIIQMNYLASMLTLNAFDNIGHEHLEYYSLLSLEYLLKRHALEVFDVELNPINGGSFRVYIRHQGSMVGNERQGRQKRRAELLATEKKMGLNKRPVYDKFVKRVHDIRQKVTSFINSETKQGRKVYIYGASNRGNTLLQFFGLDSKVITAAAERNPVKWGMKTIGTNIPIISEAQAREEKPDHFLVLPWAFLKEFINREKEYLASGGRFIVPLPTMKIISSDDLKPESKTTGV